MIAGLAADLVVVVHLAFVVFAVGGAVLVWRWPRVAWVHVPVVIWGVAIELSGGICPLTPLEQRLRAAGGQAGYEGDFVLHYIVPVLYPAGLTPEWQWVLGGALGLVNVVAYGLLWRRSSGRQKRRM